MANVNLAEMQAEMRARQQQAGQPRPHYNKYNPPPVDWDKRRAAQARPVLNPSSAAPLAGAVREIKVELLCGVYLLCEDGRYYVGEALHVYERLATHARGDSNSGLKNPRCFLLAEVPQGNDYSANKHARLIAEARFILAARAMGLQLTNRYTPRHNLPNLDAEKARLNQALAALQCA